MVTGVASVSAGGERERFRLLSSNPGKRAAERWYLIAFLLCTPLMMFIFSHSLSYTHSNDLVLSSMGLTMAVVSWGGSVIFRAAADRGKPFYEVYGFKFGCFLFCWAFIGGYLGTNPWYDVLRGHFAFNTTFNPNGVPFFMLPTTIANFGAYATILGVLYRLVWRGYKALRLPAVADILARAIVFVPLAMVMPFVETYFGTSRNYCFDNKVGEWFLNPMIYGAWFYAAFWFFLDFDETPAVRQPWREYVLKGLATVALVMLIMQLETDFVVPHITTVLHGAVFINDWSVNNCLGAKPGS
jgi:hypothetical protein